MIKFVNTNLVEIENVKFTFVQEITPECDSAGLPKQFMPQSRYEKRETRKLNAHGHGPFCRFSIGLEWAGCSGVYALFGGEKLLYIGECVDLQRRYNLGYGNIAPINCFVGGQSTNCKINTMILQQYLGGNKVYLYFHETDDYKRVERILLNSLTPPYNGTVLFKRTSTFSTKHSPTPVKNSAPIYATIYQSASGGSSTKTADVVDYIKRKMQKSQEEGVASIVIRSGEIHKELGLNSRMPTVCSAMRKLRKEGDVIIYTPPSGNGASLEIEYFL